MPNSSTTERAAPGRAPISACIISFQEQDRIGACIASLGFCDEVLVVDSHSTDGTAALAAELGARVIQRDWPGFGAQKQFCIEAAAHDWVLCIDCDETVSATLRDEIAALAAAGFPEHAGWRMPRCTEYLGRWIRHGTWYPSTQMRLFDRQRGRWVGTIHEKVELRGTVGRLRGDLYHRTYRNFLEHASGIDRYTTLIADARRARGKRAGLAGLMFRPAWSFFGFYVLRRGFLEGWRGLLLALMDANYTFYKHAKLYAAERQTAAPEPPDAQRPGS